jgi:hypothetical protein
LDPVLIFYAPELVFGGTEGVPSRFHVVRSLTCFRRYRGRRVPFSCFALPDSYLAAPRASGLVFTFCAIRLVFGSTRGVGSRFLILRARTRFRMFRGRRVPFSCFACPGSFSAVPNASGPVFEFCAPELLFDGTEGVGCCFHVLRARNRFRRTEGIGSRFYVLRSRTRFRRYRGHRVPFSCFALLDSFLAASWA